IITTSYRELALHVLHVNWRIGVIYSDITFDSGNVHGSVPRINLQIAADILYGRIGIPVVDNDGLGDVLHRHAAVTTFQIESARDVPNVDVSISINDCLISSQIFEHDAAVTIVQMYGRTSR